MTVPLPQIHPNVGDQYRHYKGDHYEVVALALHSNDDEWMVVYKPLYENAAAALFTRPLREWSEEVIWEGEAVQRFVRI